MKTRITQQDYIKAFRKASREQEIEAHNKPVFQRFTVHRSKKIYNRKKIKASVQNLPYFFCINCRNNHIIIQSPFHYT
jgi:hypothetical protein